MLRLYTGKSSATENDGKGLKEKIPNCRNVKSSATENDGKGLN